MGLCHKSSRGDDALDMAFPLYECGIFHGVVLPNSHRCEHPVVPYHLVDSNDSRRKASDIKISFPVVVKQIRERVSLDTVGAVLAIDEHDTPRMVCLHRLCHLGSQLRVVVWSDYPDLTINQMSRGIDAGSLDAEHDTLDTSQLRVFFKM